MRRKEYKRPATVVVELTQQAHLLDASLPGYESEAWTRETDHFFDEEEDN